LEKYTKALQRKFVSIVGEPKWAELKDDKDRADAGEDSDDEFFRVSLSNINVLLNTKAHN
jgi:hypothetical protein